MPQAHICQAVLGRVRKITGYPRISVLDLSCGDGQILHRVQAEGCVCRGTHFRSDDYIFSGVRPADGIAIDTGIDLLAALPYPDGEFDVVLMTEVLEHLERHDVAIREAARVLRPNGHLIFTTPNIHRIHSRWQFFLAGAHKLIRRPVGWDVTLDDWYSYHVRPVDFPTLHTQLHLAEMAVSELCWTQCKWRHAAWILLYPLFLASILWHFRSRRSQSASFRRGRHDLRRWMWHPVTLASEQLMVVAIKSGLRGTSNNH